MSLSGFRVLRVLRGSDTCFFRLWLRRRAEAMTKVPSKPLCRPASPFHDLRFVAFPDTEILGHHPYVVGIDRAG
jgi:hypothetical protein